MNRYRSNNGDRRVSFSGRIQCGKITEMDQGMNRITGMTLGEETSEVI